MTTGNGSEAHALLLEPAKITSDRALVIGDIARWSGAGRATIAFGDFAFCNLAGLRCDILRDFNPDIVLSPLIGDDFDVIEVAIILRRLGYKGLYRSISPHVPLTAIIRAEVARVAPDLDFDLLVLPLQPLTKP